MKTLKYVLIGILTFVLAPVWLLGALGWVFYEMGKNTVELIQMAKDRK